MFWVGENKYVKGLNTLSIRIWHSFNVTNMGRVLKDSGESNNLSMLCISHLIYNCAYQQLISGPIKSKLNLLLWENDINRVARLQISKYGTLCSKGKGLQVFRWGFLLYSYEVHKMIEKGWGCVWPSVCPSVIKSTYIMSETTEWISIKSGIALYTKISQSFLMSFQYDLDCAWS